MPAPRVFLAAGAVAAVLLLLRALLLPGEAEDPRADDGREARPRAASAASMPAPRVSLAAGAVAAALLLLWALLLPGEAGSAAAGWLTGLVFWLGLALGALVLLAVHALTGGGWGERLRPVLVPAIAALPVFLLLALPLLPALRPLYPWAAMPDVVEKQDLLHAWLNGPGFALRGAAALAGWAGLGWLLLRLPPGGAREVVAGLALVFHLAATTVIGFDWLQSLALPFYSTVFGMSWLLLQVLTALAWAALFHPVDRGTSQDLAGLLLAAALASLYLGFVQYLVIWYGDQPPKVGWYLPRLAPAWVWLAALSVFCAGLLPVAALLLGRVRRSPAALARLAPVILFGIFAHWAWVVVPGRGAATLVASVLGLVAVGGLWLGLAAALVARPRPVEALP
jgi:hypothetical protein